MHSSFYQPPLRVMFVRRVLWNMPKIKPQDYRQDTQDQTLPESPQMPPLTPPTPSLPTNQAEAPVVHSKRRKRPRTETKQETEISTKKEISGAETDEHAVPERRSCPWFPVPSSSTKEKLKELQEFLKQDPNACRFCGDLFCRDPTWGDPYLISCAKCDAKYHSFCVEHKHSKAAWRCYKCQHAPRPGLSSILDDNPAILCQFCSRQSPGVAGRLIVYGGLGDTVSQSNHVHENCGYYSKGVTKKEDQWFGLHTAVRESHFTKCSFCQKKGASIPCEYAKCRKLLHYPCAKSNECYLIDSNNSQHLYCDQHMEAILKNTGVNSKISTLQVPPPSPEALGAVPQSNKKKSSPRKKVNRKQSSVPDKDSDGEEDGTPSCQVL